jgi:hypothetical protein
MSADDDKYTFMHVMCSSCFFLLFGVRVCRFAILWFRYNHSYHIPMYVGVVLLPQEERGEGR